MEHESKASSLHSLNNQQSKAVTSEVKRILVLAGAGSGKTKTLLQKIEYLTKVQGVKPSHILTITFTKNAANEMIDRLIISADPKGDYESFMLDKCRSTDEKDSAREFFLKKISIN